MAAIDETLSNKSGQPIARRKSVSHPKCFCRAGVFTSVSSAKMRIHFPGWLRWTVAAAIYWISPVSINGAADSLVWRANRNQGDPEVNSWPLSKVLESISSATGWQIYVEPDTDYTVTSRFNKL